MSEKGLSSELVPPPGHRYHVVDGLEGQWLCETTDAYPEPSPIGRVSDLLDRVAAVEALAAEWERAGFEIEVAQLREAIGVHRG